jgi:hypothetical protein
MKINLFFRDDDLGMELNNFYKLMDLFYFHGQKLNAAAVPSYIKKIENFEKLYSYKGFLEVHTHGFSHENYQSEGKKSEFGSERNSKDVLIDLVRGKKIIEEHFSDMNFEAFTPPWNRLENQFVNLLSRTSFKILSRDGLQISSEDDVRDLNVAIDLHTAKPARKYSCKELFDLITEKQMKTTNVGVMLHHRHMDNEDFDFMHMFLEYLNQKGVKANFYSDIYNEGR